MTNAVRLPVDGAYVLRYRVNSMGVPILYGSSEPRNSIEVSIAADDRTDSFLLVFSGDLPVTPQTMLVGGFFSEDPACAAYETRYDSAANRLECRFPIPRGSGDACVWDAKLTLRTTLPFVKVTVKVYRL